MKPPFNFLITIFTTLFLLNLSGCAKHNYDIPEDLSHYNPSDFETYSRHSGMCGDCRDEITRSILYIIHTSGVPDETYALVADGLNKIIDEAGRSINVLDDTVDFPQCYRTPDWYQSETRLDKNHLHGYQSDAGAIIDLLRSHDTHHDHFIVLITDADITSGREGNNFVYGLSSYPYIVISARRFLDWKEINLDGYPDETFDRALTLVSAHEFGHYLDLVRRDFNCWNDTDTLLDRHCKGENGPCLMEQVNVEGCKDVLEQADILYEREHWLCPDCTAELFFRMSELEERGFVW